VWLWQAKSFWSLWASVFLVFKVSTWSLPWPPHTFVCVCVCVWERERERIKIVCELVWKWRQTINSKYQRVVSLQGKQRSSPIVWLNHLPPLENLWNIKEATIIGATSVNESRYKEPLLPHLKFFLSQQDQHIDPVAWISFFCLVGFNTRSHWNLGFYAFGHQNKWKVNIDLLSSVLPPGEKSFYPWKFSSC